MFVCVRARRQKRRPDCAASFFVFATQLGAGEWRGSATLKPFLGGHKKRLGRQDQHAARREAERAERIPSYSKPNKPKGASTSNRRPSLHALLRMWWPFAVSCFFLLSLLHERVLASRALLVQLY